MLTLLNIFFKFEDSDCNFKIPVNDIPEYNTREIYFRIIVHSNI